MMYRRFTQEERAFFTSFVPGHSHKEIQAAFINKFGWPIKLSQIKGFIANNGLSTGRTGRFEKGCIPPNKGKKGIRVSQDTEFKRGNRPQNAVSVGTEIVDAYGYIKVKIAEPNVWKFKHRIIWEEHYGSIPAGHVLIFADRDKMNCTLDNLILVSRAELVRMNQQGLIFKNKELTKTGLLIAKVATMAGSRK